VFETHIDNTAVTAMIARINRRGELPILLMMAYSAIRRSISYF